MIGRSMPPSFAHSNVISGRFLSSVLIDRLFPVLALLHLNAHDSEEAFARKAG
jgi:hypothetical protein